MSFASLTDDTPVDPDDESLVAYLDGELNRQERTELENRLLDDAVLRSRLQQLQTGWDMLEALPAATPSAKLVETTLKLAVSDLVRTKPLGNTRSSRMWWPFGIAVACLVGVLGAFAVFATIKNQNYIRELHDLAIAENFDAYNEGGDLELIRQLAANPDWTKMASANRELSGGDADATGISSLPVEDRELAISQLPLEEQAQLHSRWERFTRLDEDSRNRIRQTAEAVARQPDRELLLRSMQAYVIWRQSLPHELVDKIESADPAVRRGAINEAVEKTMDSISKRSSMTLDEESIERIYFALQQIFEQRLQDRDGELTKLYSHLKQRFADRDPQWFAMAWLFGPREYRNRRGPGPFGPSVSRFMDKYSEPMRSDEWEMIKLVLKADDRETLEMVADGSPLSEAMTLKYWVEEAIRRKAPWPRHADATWLDRYNELSPSERDVIDLMPPSEMIEALTTDRRRFWP